MDHNMKHSKTGLLKTEVLGSKKGQDYKLSHSKEGFIQSNLINVLGDAAAFSSLSSKLQKDPKYQALDSQEALVKYFGELWESTNK